MEDSPPETPSPPSPPPSSSQSYLKSPQAQASVSASSSPTSPTHQARRSKNYMGQEISKSSNSNSSSSHGKNNSDSTTKPSRRSRLRRRLRLLRHRNGSGTRLKLTSAEDFIGIALIEIIEAKMKFKINGWLAFLWANRPFGLATSDQTDTPRWKSEKKLLLERNGPHIVRISVFETNRVSKNNLVGYCEIDLYEALTEDSDSGELLDLLDPSSPQKVVGSISISCSVEDLVDTEKRFARKILSIMDHDRDGKLSFTAFADLIGAFGKKVPDNKKEELFKKVDKNGLIPVNMKSGQNIQAWIEFDEMFVGFSASKVTWV